MKKGFFYNKSFIITMTMINAVIALTMFYLDNHIASLGWLVASSWGIMTYNVIVILDALLKERFKKK